jgi:hypothetical protein
LTNCRADEQALHPYWHEHLGADAVSLAMRGKRVAERSEPLVK